MTLLAVTYLIGVILFLLFTAYFCGIETAAISANRSRLQQLKLRGDERAKEILKLLSDIQQVIAVVLVGTNISMVLSSMFGRKFAAQYLGDTVPISFFGGVSVIELVNLIILTPTFLLVAEILPKQIFRHKADKLMLALGLPIKYFALLFLPLLKVLNFFVLTLLSPTGIGTKTHRITFTKEDLAALLDVNQVEHKADEKSLERRMIRKIFNLEKTLTREIMRPINDVVAIRLGQETINSVIQLAQKTGYSRFPVYRDRIINLIGYVEIYQIMRADVSDRRLEDFVQTAYYVPETKPVDDLLEQMLKRGEHVAIVVDEYGACSGMVTLEDVLEEIVGEIEDEFHRTAIDIIKEDQDTYVTEAKINIQELNERLNLNLPKKGYETLGGLIYTY
ncbi:MAG: hemolysin family protein, partial [Candidatus Sumerlaeia bacterium]|nr:hemolysin family protein [Candidatus Sumerlaeia bacterium]